MENEPGNSGSRSSGGCCTDSNAYDQSVYDHFQSAVTVVSALLQQVGPCVQIGNKKLNYGVGVLCADTVYAGPVEATAMGNILTQAMAKGEISSLREIREVVSRSADAIPQTERIQSGKLNCAFV